MERIGSPDLFHGATLGEISLVLEFMYQGFNWMWHDGHTFQRPNKKQIKNTILRLIKDVKDDPHVYKTSTGGIHVQEDDCAGGYQVTFAPTFTFYQVEPSCKELEGVEG
jgi:hypothetical protein